MPYRVDEEQAILGGYDAGSDAERIAQWCNEREDSGWTLVSVTGTRYIFHKPKKTEGGEVWGNGF